MTAYTIATRKLPYGKIGVQLAGFGHAPCRPGEHGASDDGRRAVLRGGGVGRYERCRTPTGTGGDARLHLRVSDGGPLLALGGLGARQPWLGQNPCKVRIRADVALYKRAFTRKDPDREELTSTLAN